MKLLRYGEKGSERPGLLDRGGVIRDLSRVIADINGAALMDLDRLRSVPPASLPEVAGCPRIGPCVAGVGKFICIGLNYADHAAETGAEPPSEPIVFFKATSAIAGPDDPLHLPSGAAKLDWEVELGVVIGSPVSSADEKQALAAIAGYCVINDYSERAWQLERGGQWVKGKSADGFGPLGPWLVTPDEVGSTSDLRMWLKVDGYFRQQGSTATMIFKPAEIVSYLSQFMSLQPGDVVSTGTPPGVGMGRRPPVYLSPGQVVELGIEGLGAQRQLIT